MQARSRICTKLWPRWYALLMLSPRRCCCWRSMTPGTHSPCTSRPQSHSPVYRLPMVLASTPAPSPCCWPTTMPLKTEGRILASGCWCITGSALLKALYCMAVDVEVVLFFQQGAAYSMLPRGCRALGKCMHLCACDSARELSNTALAYLTICIQLVS